jgi:hypothetical protein
MKSIIRFLIFITILYCTFQPVSSDCIKLMTSSSSNKCFDIVTINTTYIDKTGNLRHGNVDLISTSGALSNTIQNPIMILSFICAMVYFIF